MRTLLLALFLSTSLAWADQASIVNVRKNIPLADDEPAFRDFYIGNADSLSLKKNQILTVIRKTSVLDAQGVHNYGELEIPVGQVKVIMISGRLAVAREHKLFSRDEIPTLEQRGIMIGDLISTTEH